MGMHPRTVSLSSSQILWFYEEPPFRADLSAWRGASPGTACLRVRAMCAALTGRSDPARNGFWGWIRFHQKIIVSLSCSYSVLQSPGISAQPKTPGFGVESPFHRWLLVVGVPCLLMDTFLP